MKAGMNITPDTCGSLGGGEPYDLALTIDALVAAARALPGQACQASCTV